MFDTMQNITPMNIFKNQCQRVQSCHVLNFIFTMNYIERKLKFIIEYFFQ